MDRYTAFSRQMDNLTARYGRDARFVVALPVRGRDVGEDLTEYDVRGLAWVLADKSIPAPRWAVIQLTLPFPA